MLILEDLCFNMDVAKNFFFFFSHKGMSKQKLNDPHVLFYSPLDEIYRSD